MSNPEKKDDLSAMLGKTWRSREATPEPTQEASASPAPPAPAPAPAQSMEPPAERIRKARRERVVRDSFSTRVRIELLNAFYAEVNETKSSVVDLADEMFSDFMKKRGRDV